MTHRVLITTPHPNWPLWRQAPQLLSPNLDASAGHRVGDASCDVDTLRDPSAKDRIVQWGDCTFYIDLPVREVDTWVVFENLVEPI